MSNYTKSYFLYILLSVLYSIHIPIMSNWIRQYNPELGDVYFFISTTANFGFLSTHFCPFRIFSRWIFNHHLNLWTYCRRTYKSQGRWIIALIMYLPALIILLLGTFYLLIK